MLQDQGAPRGARRSPDELVSLYAKRQASPGAFSPDTPWQAELKDAFSFAETVDQLTAIKRSRRTWKPIPMDQVICGDVGCNKDQDRPVRRRRSRRSRTVNGSRVRCPTTPTENARRSASRCPFSDHQGFGSPTPPVRAVIGVGRWFYHRLLQTGVRWKDLGWWWSTSSGSRRAQGTSGHCAPMSTCVHRRRDPRTLEMSLAGFARYQMSAPPEATVLTYVGPHGDKQIARRCAGSCCCDGQAFTCTTGVKARSRRCAARVRELVPGRRSGGRFATMPRTIGRPPCNGSWNTSMTSWFTATIVETGLDISNANTLIVRRADYLRAVQLHQLSGRVGYSRDAATPISHPPQVPLTETACDRLAIAHRTMS